MTTKALTAFGMIYYIEETTIQDAFKVLETLYAAQTPPVVVTQTLAQELELTSGEATALFIEWRNRNKPIY